MRSRQAQSWAAGSWPSLPYQAAWWWGQSVRLGLPTLAPTFLTHDVSTRWHQEVCLIFYCLKYSKTMLEKQTTNEYLLNSQHFSYIMSFIFTTAMWRWSCHMRPHFTDEDIQAQRSHSASKLRSHEPSLDVRSPCRFHDVMASPS